VRVGYGWYFNTSVYNNIVDRLAQQPPFATSSVVASRADRVLTIRNGFGGTPDRQVTNTYAVDPNYRVGYAQSWNVAIQQNLGRALVGEISYIGTKGTHLDMLRIPNRALNASPFTYESSDGNSILHGGSLRLTRRFSRGLSAEFRYTLARSIDNASNVGGSGGGRVLQDAFNFAAERGLSTFDNRHVIAANWRFTMRKWALASTITYRSGQPLTPTVLGNRADVAGTGVTGTVRADATGQPVGSDSQLFNLSAFRVPQRPTFGNAGRGTIPGPGLFLMNASVSRGFSLGEGRALELRLDANNVLNHVNITGWGTVVNASNYGLATAVGTMRNLNANLRFRF
jgi:hypothetical protein